MAAALGNKAIINLTVLMRSHITGRGVELSGGVTGPQNDSDAVPIETPARLGGGTRTSRRVQLGPGYKRVAVERRSRYNL